MGGSSVLPLSSQFMLCEFGSLGENVSLPRPPHSRPLPWQDTQVVPSMDLHQSIHIFPTDSHPQTAAPNQAVACGRGGRRTRLKTFICAAFSPASKPRGVSVTILGSSVAQELVLLPPTFQRCKADPGVLNDFPRTSSSLALEWGLPHAPHCCHPGKSFLGLMRVSV